MKRAIGGLTLAVGVAIAVSIACGGSGSPDNVRKIDSFNVVVAATPCAAGFEHAVVCCIEGDCWTRDDAPFVACGGTAYPDALRCCSLNDPKTCDSCDSKTDNCGATPLARVRLAGGCQHCQPGYSGDPSSPGGCCQSNGSSKHCLGGGSVGTPCVGTGCPPAPPPCAPLCAPGFTLTGPQVDVCCRDRVDEDPICYVWLPGDPNVMSCGTAGTTCGCRELTDGHEYQMDCDDATQHCTCAVDGTQRAAFSPDGGTCEAGTQAAWKQCGFP